MTLALVMFIWGMYKYGMRIYHRFALTGDGSITGKFEIGDDGTADAAQPAGNVGAKAGIGELLSGTGITDAPPPGAPAPKKRTQEVEKIIGLVEPKPSQPGGSTAMPSHSTPVQQEQCAVQ